MASQDENEVANRIGSHAYYEMVQCVSTALSYGITLSLFYTSLGVLIKRRSDTTSRKFLLALTCFMFLLNTGLFVSYIAYDLTLFAWARDVITENTPPLEDRLLASDTAIIPYAICQLLFEILNFIIGDAIVLWRVAVLWPRSRFIRGGLCFLLLVDIAVSAYDLVVIGTDVVSSSGKDTSGWIHVDTARILVSLGVNLLATLTIAVKTWQFRNTLRLGFSKAATRKSLVNQTLTLLVECGLIFCAIQILYAIINLVVAPKAHEQPIMSPLSLFNVAIESAFPFTAGMYPSIVILVMAKQRSIFGTSTLVACSQNDAADNKPDRRQSLALSTLHFATSQEITGQTSSVTRSTAGNVQESSKYGTHVAFVPDAESAV